MESLSEATPLFAAVLWLAAHRIVLSRGFTLRGGGRSTDTTIGLSIVGSTVAWSIVSIQQRSRPFDNSIHDHALPSIARLPLIALVLSGVWIALGIENILASYSIIQNRRLWNLRHVNGQFDWSHGLARPLHVAIYVTIAGLSLTASVTAVLSGHPVTGSLHFAGMVVFLLSGTSKNVYNEATHYYTGDNLRIALPTSHHEGTVYVLPTAGRGIDAVWSPKVPNEHLEADTQAMALFSSMRSGKWSPNEPLERLRQILPKYQARVTLTTDQATALAKWIYAISPVEESQKSMRRIACERAKNMHLIGRDLIYTLCHAEYLVFMAQGRLPPDLQDQIGKLRLMKRSGAVALTVPEIPTIGYKAGLVGYREAVRHVYAIFNEPVDDFALEFQGCEPPTFSPALNKAASNISQYASELWDLSLTHSESTLTALYFFSTVWFIEMGNVNGFHPFPLRCRSQEGDIISQHVVWRQAWFCGLTSQMISSIPLFFVAYVAGRL